MSLALTKLFELFSPSDYEAFDEEEIGYAGGLCLPEVCMALKDAVQTVYQYSVTGGYEKSFDYRGVELFNQRGCLILSDVEQMVFDEAETTYATELWLLEDMSFAIVHCVKMKIGSEDTGYVTEYRAFKKPLEISEDISPTIIKKRLRMIRKIRAVSFPLKKRHLRRALPLVICRLPSSPVIHFSAGAMTRGAPDMSQQQTACWAIRHYMRLIPKIRRSSRMRSLLLRARSM